MGSQDMDHHTSTIENKIPSGQIANIVHDGIYQLLEKKIESTCFYSFSWFLVSPFLKFFLFSGTDICGAPMKLGPTKNWTFPNLKASAESTEVYLGVGDAVEPVTHKSSFKRVSVTLYPDRTTTTT